MSGRTLYDVLGVPREADLDDIKKAYRKIALESHPDRNPGDAAAEARFKEATKAYSVLNDPGAKQAYDLELAIGGPSGNPFGRGGSGDPFADMFDDLIRNVRYAGEPGRPFRRGRRSAGPPPDPPVPGEDLETELVITLEEAASGCLKEVNSVSRVKTACGACFGQRAMPGSRLIPCSACSGSGVTLDFKVGPGSRARKCPACRGFGSIPMRPCTECGGEGKVHAKKSVKVRVPVGIDEGHRLRLAGMGTPGNGGTPGDLYVTIRVAPHETFKRDGPNLFLEHGVPLGVAIRGGSVMIPTLDGPPVGVVVPAGVVPGKTVVTVTGAGIRSMLHQSRGNLHVTLQVTMPKISTARGERLLDELLAELEKTARPL